MRNGLYGKYTYVRDKTWRVIIDYNIDKLPVRLMAILEAHSIEVNSYRDAKADLIKLGVYHLCSTTEAFTLYIKGRWYIFYNDDITPRQRIRFTLAHELGHIVLGHKMQRIKTTSGVAYYTMRNTAEWVDDPMETEANMFAARVLAPAIVLRRLEVYSPSGLQELCGLSRQAAEIRAARMSLLLERERDRLARGLKSNFGLSPLERQVEHQFMDFINNR